jgi:hypothetical protein
MFDPDDGGAAFVPEMIDNDKLGDPLGANAARDPKLKDTSILGACRKSGWHRTCSFWVSLHVMAYRADALGIGSRFFQSAVNVLASGATMCGGCTLHLQALHTDILGSIHDDLAAVH